MTSISVTIVAPMTALSARWTAEACQRLSEARVIGNLRAPHSCIRARGGPSRSCGNLCRRVERLYGKTAAEEVAIAVHVVDARHRRPVLAIDERGDRIRGIPPAVAVGPVVGGDRRGRV